MDGYISKSAFAQVYGCAPSYVSKLKALNRLVLSEDGKLVNVEASLKLIEATGDPGKTGVRERWEAYRNGHDLASMPAPAKVADQEDEQASGRSRGGGDKAPSAYHQARTEKEQIDAQLKMIELRKLQGTIAEVAPMVQAVQATHIAARTALMQLPDRLAQLIAPETDPVKVHELLRLECERVCEVMRREVERLRERAEVTV